MSFKIPCGGFELDEKVFSLDENDVLSLSGGGGSSDFVVNFSTSNMQAFNADKTYAEVVEAIKSGKFVRSIVTITAPDDTITVQSTYVLHNNSQIVFGWTMVDSGSNVSFVQITYAESGIEAITANIKPTT